MEDLENPVKFEAFALLDPKFVGYPIPSNGFYNDKNFVVDTERIEEGNPLVIELAQKNQWIELLTLINREAETHRFFTTVFDPETRKSILHYACDQDKKKDATRYVEALLSRAKRTKLSRDELIRFVNHADNENTTALHTAATRANKDLVELLVRSGADVNVRLENKRKTDAISLIYQNVPKAILCMFYRSINITEDEDDPDEDYWQVECDFCPVTGVRGPSEENIKDGLLLCEMSLLSRALREKQMKRSEVLLHPLVQIFLHLKGEKFKYLIWISMFYHILWSFLCTIYIAKNSQFPSGANSSRNHPEQLRLFEQGESSEAIRMGWNIGFLCFYLFTLVKEIVEVKCCPDFRYYINQLENVGQWVLLGGIFLIWLFSFFVKPGGEADSSVNFDLICISNIISAIGIFTAWLLVLGQFNKLKTLGIYMEMLQTVSISISKFLFAFSPLLIAFALTFQLLMPDMDQFSFPWPPWGIIKLFAMMTGELNYDETFHSDETEQNVPNVGLTKFLYLAFIVLVTIVLQNLLIGLTISDIQDLQRQAKEGHLATQLEQIYLLERFLLQEWIQSLMRKLRLTPLLQKLFFNALDMNTEKGGNNVLNQRLKDFPQSLQTVILENVKNEKLKVKKSSTESQLKN